MHGGRKSFILLVDDCTRYIWLRLLAIKHFQAKMETETENKLKV